MSITRLEKQKLKELGLRVKQVRIERGLTLKELGHIIDKDPQSISRLEVGGINPSYLYLVEICKGLEIELIDLLKDLE